DPVRFLLAFDIQLLQLFSIERSKAGFECIATRRIEQGGDLPIILADKTLDLRFPIADEAERHRLHTAGRTSAWQLAPQYGREREAHEIVECAAGKISIHQRGIDLSRRSHC